MTGGSWRLLGASLALLLPAGGCRPRDSAMHAADELFRAGRYEAAAQAYATLPEDSGDWRAYGAWRAAAIFRGSLHDPTRAEVAYSACARSHPESEWGYNCAVELGDLLLETGRPRDAISAYRDAVQRWPGGTFTAHCLLQSGNAYVELGEPSQARVEWEEAIAKAPDGPLVPELRLSVARSWDLEGKPDKALTAYRRFVQKTPNHSLTPQARLGEAEALEGLGRLEEAERVLQQVLATHPNPEAIRLRLESVQERRARRDQEASGPVMDHGVRLDADE